MWYRSPIRIVSHIEGTKITPALVEKRTKELQISHLDKVNTFLMYDMDVRTINEKLQKCKAQMFGKIIQRLHSQRLKRHS